MNQRGVSSTITSTGICIDRWYLWKAEDDDVNITISDGGITFNNSSSYFQQHLPVGTFDSNKTYTLVIYYADGGVTSHTPALYFNNNGIDIINIAWVMEVGRKVAHFALYEGAYTAETAPTYQPKGYAAELAECQRYYQVIPFRSNYTTPVAAGVRYSATHTRIPLIFPQDFRITPTMTIDSTLTLKVTGGGMGTKTVAHSDIAISSAAKNKVTLHIGNKDLAFTSGYSTFFYGNGVEGEGIQCIRFSADL